MKTPHFGLPTLLLTLCLTSGCTVEPGGAPAGDSSATHDHDHDHDHDHGTAVGDHGKETALGEIEIGGVLLDVRQYGELAGGTEMAFGLDLRNGNVKSIRAWIGPRTGVGSMKGKAEDEGEGHYHVHVTAPVLVQVDHQLWIEVESPEGTKSLGTLAVHR
jgi:hypothetical protein